MGHHWRVGLFPIEWAQTILGLKAQTFFLDGFLKPKSIIYLFIFIYIKPILNGTGLQVHDLLPYERPKCPYYTCIRFGIPGIKSRTSLTTKSVLWETIVPFKKALRPPSWLGPCPSTNPRKDQGNPTQPIKEGGSKTKEKRKEQGKVNQLLDLLQAD